MTEARLLKDDITRAISYYREPTMEAPSRSIGYGRQPMAIVVLLVLFILGVIAAILLFR